MRRVLATDTGADLYCKRQQMIEPVFADTKFNRRIDRFLRRVRSAARCEWRLITASGSLLKLHRHQLRPARPLNPAGAAGGRGRLAPETQTSTPATPRTRHAATRPAAPFRNSLHGMQT
jgi:hypothetical protein